MVVSVGPQSSLREGGKMFGNRQQEPMWSGCLNRGCILVTVVAIWLVVNAINCAAGVGQ